MSYHIYQTEAYVLGGKNIGEANRYLFLFTKDLGMIGASAQGIRLLKSKLRYSLQDFSYCTVALVRGKNIWRVTNAKGEENVQLSFRSSPRKAELVSRIFSLLSRMLPGEEKNVQLFDLLNDALSFLKTELREEEIKNFECLLVLRILSNLGYIGKGVLQEFAQGAMWNGDILQEMNKLRPQALFVINQSLSASSL